MFAELDRLTEQARTMAGGSEDPAARLAALQKLIYRPGPWNADHPFQYDMRDPDGQHMPNKLLHNLLKNRLGQCVSMPILFLIIGERLGLDLALACAPNHVFIRYTAPDGRVFNLETTSGAYPARLEWFQQNMPMSDRALESGIYMRSLPQREAVAVMAGVVAEQLSRNSAGRRPCARRS